MQKTRQQILEYLQQHGEATVDELSRALDGLTAVTIRHHLDVLRSQGLIAKPQVRHRSTPGRPKYVYTLTDQASAIFPKNFQALTDHLLHELKSRMDEQEVNVLFQDVATRIASEASPLPDGASMEERLNHTVAYLGKQGYVARWEPHREGYVLHTSNCPYKGVSDNHGQLCVMDAHLIRQLLGVVPRRLTHIAEGDGSCSYLISEIDG